MLSIVRTIKNKNKLAVVCLSLQGNCLMKVVTWSLLWWCLWHWYFITWHMATGHDQLLNTVTWLQHFQWVALGTDRPCDKSLYVSLYHVTLKLALFSSDTSHLILLLVWVWEWMSDPDSQRKSSIVFNYYPFLVCRAYYYSTTTSMYLTS